MSTNIHPKVTGATLGAALGTFLVAQFGAHLPSAANDVIPIICTFLGGYIPGGPNQ